MIATCSAFLASCALSIPAFASTHRLFNKNTGRGYSAFVYSTYFGALVFAWAFYGGLSRININNLGSPIEYTASYLPPMIVSLIAFLFCSLAVTIAGDVSMRKAKQAVDYLPLN